MAKLYYYYGAMGSSKTANALMTKFNYGEVLKAALKNRPLIGVMIATIGSMLSITGSGQLNSYMFKEVYQNTSVMTISSLLSLPGSLVPKCFLLSSLISCTSLAI